MGRRVPGRGCGGFGTMNAEGHQRMKLQPANAAENSKYADILLTYPGELRKLRTTADPSRFQLPRTGQRSGSSIRTYFLRAETSSSTETRPPAGERASMT